MRRDPLDDGERREHAERAVEPAGVGNGVEVRAEHERPVPVPSRPMTLPTASRRTVSPASSIQPATSRPPRERGRPEPAGEPVRLLADLPERVGAGENVGCRTRHGRRGR